ncbi:MAG TPA: nuclear transport factor 2 family protein [Opitutaceae bacterium]|nr:nuclear transport factor 2 family protein [Opitutaceae bacterium]
MRRNTLEADIAAIRELVRALDRAIVARDAAGLTRILSDDFVGATPMGQSFAKGDYIEFHCHAHAGPLEIVSGPLDASRIRIHGNCAVVNRRVQVRKSGPGDRVERFAVQRIEVGVKRRGGWRLVSGQGTRVAAGLPAS